MNNRERITEMWKTLAKHRNAYFEFYLQTDNWVKTDTCPSENANLNLWRVTIPPKKWKPKHNKWYVNVGKKIDNEFTRETDEQVKDLAKRLKTLALIDAWAVEHNAKKKFITGQPNRYVIYSLTEKKWVNTMNDTFMQPTVTYMTVEGAMQLAKSLNSGEVELP